MTLVRFDPFRDIATLQSRINNLFSDAFTRGGEEARDSWAPAVDIFERGEDLVLRAEVPGVAKDDLDVQVEGNVLTLRGQRIRDKEIREESYYRVERSYGSFSRSFTLPSTVDATRIAATSRDGILEVVLPKAEEAKPKRITVKAS